MSFDSYSFGDHINNIGLIVQANPKIYFSFWEKADKY